MSVGRQGPFVQERAVLRRQRALPVDGEVLLDIGDRVHERTVVARATGRGTMHTVNAASQLDILASELPGAMLCAVGERVERDQPLARSRGLFGLLASECRAPVAGTVAAVSPHTGRILLEEPGQDLEVAAFLPGIVADRLPGRGVVVAGWGARVAGVFGVGGEVSGEMIAAVGRADVSLEAAAIDHTHAGKVLLAGSLVTADALERASAFGVAGIVTGGVHDTELSRWLGQETVLADTTHLDAPLTLVVTGGFGRAPMETETFALLAAHRGRTACLSGLTRVRAGARRPEVIIPLDEDPRTAVAPSSPPSLQIGARVMVVRSPWFGCIGRVGALPVEPVRMECGARCLVAHVDLDDGVTAAIPRANLEVLGERSTDEEDR
jgi:hypothetical protein